MQTYLKNLTALHSADMQANDSKALGRPVRRDPITTVHPLIRTNPVTGWNALFFNPGFVTKIIGIPKAESDAILKYLTDVVATTNELHARFQWNKDDVAIWDNRTTVCLTLPNDTFNILIEPRHTLHPMASHHTDDTQSVLQPMPSVLFWRQRVNPRRKS